MSHEAGDDDESVEIDQEVEKHSMTDDSTSAATTVFTNPSLMMSVGVLQASVWTPVKNVIDFATEDFGPLGPLLHNVGALPRLAIIMGNLEALQAIYLLAQSRPHPRYSFRWAMHIAACFNDLEILKWLHTLPGDEDRCRPDTIAITARHDYVDVVEWLHQHYRGAQSPCPLMQSTRHCDTATLRRSSSVALLEVCHRCKIAVLTLSTVDSVNDQWLLRSEDQFYTKQVALDVSPPALRPCIVRWMILSPTVLTASSLQAGTTTIARTTRWLTKLQTLRWMREPARKCLPQQVDHSSTPSRSSCNPTSVMSNTGHRLDQVT